MGKDTGGRARMGKDGQRWAMMGKKDGGGWVMMRRDGEGLGKEGRSKAAESQALRMCTAPDCHHPLPHCGNFGGFLIDYVIATSVLSQRMVRVGNR